MEKNYEYLTSSWIVLLLATTIVYGGCSGIGRVQSTVRSSGGGMVKVSTNRKNPKRRKQRKESEQRVGLAPDDVITINGQCLIGSTRHEYGSSAKVIAVFHFIFII